MKLRALLLAVSACVATPLALAQWQWIDKDGRKVFSDSAPPPEVPAEKILRQPGGRALPHAASTPASAAVPAPAASAALPKPATKDSALEQKRKAAASAEEQKRLALEAENARIREDNCAQARRSKATLASGIRIAQVNDKGEREFMDDAARAAETQRVDAVIARDCR